MDDTWEPLGQFSNRRLRAILYHDWHGIHGLNGLGMIRDALSVMMDLLTGHEEMNGSAKDAKEREGKKKKKMKEEDKKGKGGVHEGY
ncbi:hypothetical protein [Candidatus Entotheonella palauensis]|uniref:hypothetical protein n=1 Tax=Candidatus Entotheonella palauensis TaxID=93172 RepID=UPI000B7E9E9B|nr:hypothetical protein [Candidatus Entotheonella palauensis]